MEDSKLVELAKLLIEEKVLKRYVYLIQNKDLSFKLKRIFYDEEVPLSYIHNTNLKQIYKKGATYRLYSCLNFEESDKLPYTLLRQYNSLNELFTCLNPYLSISEIYERITHLLR